jgi:hypothetical protein
MLRYSRSCFIDEALDASEKAWQSSANAAFVRHLETNVNIPNLVMTNIAMENEWPIEIDGLPIKDGWIFPWRTVSHNQMVYV